MRGFENQIEESLLPIKDAAQRVGYSRDYVARIAREGKVVAKQRGRQWYVSLASLEQFVADAAYEREVRRRYLSAERRAEREAKERLAEVTQRNATLRARAPRVAGAAVVFVFAFGLGVASLLLNLTGAQQLAHWSFVPAAAPLARESVIVEYSEVPRTVSDRSIPSVRTEVPLTPHFATEREQSELAATADELLVLGQAGREFSDPASVSSFFSHPIVLGRDERGGWRIYRASEDGEPLGVGVPFVAIPQSGAPPPAN